MYDKFGFAFKEASTWQGLIMLISGLAGWSLSDEESNTLVSLGVSVVGLIGIITRRVSSE